MKKRFYSDALALVVGSSLIALIVAVIYFTVSMYISSGTTLMVFLGYLTDFCNAISMFIGFGTVIYAFFKFDFYEGVMSLLILLLSFVPFFIYQSIAGYIYMTEASSPEGSEAFSVGVMNVYQAMGSGVINQLLPAVLIAFITCKIVKTSKVEPQKFISWSNRLQKSMIVSCIVLFGINIIAFIITGILPELIDNDFVFQTKDAFGSFVGYIALNILENAFVYLVLAYLTFITIYKFYSYRLNGKINSEKEN
ncbi:MAG: hypothetical protein J6A54_02290 [Clostridia bacterium]|nr:hypothetical protein [Clostridia bacterium]